MQHDDGHKRSFAGEKFKKQRIHLTKHKDSPQSFLFGGGELHCILGKRASVRQCWNGLSWFPPAGSLVLVVLLVLAVRERGTREHLPVSVQPLLQHLRDERVMSASAALLQRHQRPAVCHAAVQPLPEQTLLLLLTAHLKHTHTHTSSVNLGYAGSIHLVYANLRISHHITLDGNTKTCINSINVHKN